MSELIAPSPENQLSVVVREHGLELESAKNVLAVFTPLLEQAEDWRNKVALIKVTDASQVREMKLARESRLALKEIRVNAEKARKKLKEDSLRRGKAIDGAYNILEFIIAPLEKNLEEQEKFVEIRETARKASLKRNREERLAQFSVDTSFYKLDEMPDLDFEELFQMIWKKRYEAKAAAEKAAEELRAKEKAQQEEQARIKAENERLKQEAAAREEELRQERLREQARREVERQKQQAEKEAADKIVAAEKAELQRKADAAEKARKDLEYAEHLRKQEEDAKRFAEERARKQAAEDAHKAAAAPDREKLKAFAATIRAIELPALYSRPATAALQDTFKGLAEFIETLV